MKRTKYILIILTALLFIECRSKSNSNTITVKKTENFDLGTTKPNLNQTKLKRKELFQITANDKFSISDFKNMKFVWKGLRNIDKLENIELGRDRNRKLDPFENDNTVAIITGYSDEINPRPFEKKTVLLTMYFQSNEVYTIWETEQDSFMFKQILEPIQNGKYSGSLIDSIFEVQGKKIISGMTLGGEGGETWNSFWVKQVKNDSILVLEETPIKYNIHLESQEYDIDYNYPQITRRTFINSFGKNKDTMRSTINIIELIKEKGL